jgi:hypothetical protein
VASPPRITAAALDNLFDHPAGVLNISINSRITFFMAAKWFFNGLQASQGSFPEGS